jgi:hypothetical protein
MLNLLDASLERFLRQVVPLPERDIEISFDAPDREWGASVTKPTVNLYLWDIRRNVDEVASGMAVGQDAGGRWLRQRPRPRVDCRYLISAWTSDVRDEHALLGSVLAAVLPRSELGVEHLERGYADVRPLPTMKVASAGDDDKSDFWSALGGQLKPGLDLLVTATVDSVLASEAGPPVERYRIGVTDLDGRRRSGAGFAGGTAAAPGAVVRSPRGSAVAGDDGRFVVAAEEGDPLTIEGEAPKTTGRPRKR